VSKYFEESKAPTVQACAEALKLAANGGTVYSQVYDLSQGTVYVYYRHNFDRPFKVNLEEELREGPHQVMLKDAFQDSWPNLVLPKITASAAISAVEVARKSLQARGGARAATNIHSIHAKGVINVDVGFVAASPVEIYEMRPNRYRSVIHLKSPVGLALDQATQGFDGQTGWDAQAGAPARILTGKELQERRDGAAFFGWYNDPAVYASSDCLGEASFEGATCYVLHTISKYDRDKIHYYEFYDTKSFLLLGVIESTEAGSGPELKQTCFGGYRKFNGFLLPTRLTGRSQLSNWQIHFESFELNKVEESALKMPAQSAAARDDLNEPHRADKP
jgi:hypothetical protein